jgi:hypothetical protein
MVIVYTPLFLPGMTDGAAVLAKGVVHLSKGFRQQSPAID